MKSRVKISSYLASLSVPLVYSNFPSQTCPNSISKRRYFIHITRQKAINTCARTIHKHAYSLLLRLLASAKMSSLSNPPSLGAADGEVGLDAPFESCCGDELALIREDICIGAWGAGNVPMPIDVPGCTGKPKPSDKSVVGEKNAFSRSAGSSMSPCGGMIVCVVMGRD